MSYHLTLKDIQKQTGLKDTFIRRCLSNMKDIFEPHLSRGENNALVFDDNASALFDRIKQLKENDNLTLPEIKKRLGYKPIKPDDKVHHTEYQSVLSPPVKPHETYTEKELIDKVLEEKERLLQEKDKSYQAQLKAQQMRIEELQSRLHLLTDGRRPEDMKREAEEKGRLKKEIFEKLEDLEGKWFKAKERKELVARLKELM